MPLHPLAAGPSAATRPWQRCAAVGALLAVVSCGAFAAGTGWEGTPSVTQLWVTHVLAAVVAGGATFALGRSWALAGIVVMLSVAYAWPPVVDAADIVAGTQAFGSTYPFQATASALFIPLLAIGGLVARNSIGDLGQFGSNLLAGVEGMLARRVNHLLARRGDKLETR